ncbi:MAG: glycosyltransferase family 4 protein, partial [Bacteroidota bacterium]
MTERSHITDFSAAPRVALFAGAYNHIADGVTRTLNRLVGYLESASFEVRVFAPTVDRPQVRHEGTLLPVPSVRAPGRPDYRFSLGLTPAVRQQLESFNPDLYHIATPDLLGLQALKHAGRRGIPVVASYHTHFASYLQYYHLHALEPLVWAYLRWFYRQCREIYVPSASMAEVLAERGIEQGVRLWERGVDTTLFHPSRRSLAWRRRLGFSDDDVIVSFVSRLVWEKGLRRMADILQQLRGRGASFRTLIVGDGPARADLAELLPEAVFTGYLEGEDLATAYASTDVFLFPSDTETFGNATLEAMASGTPPVCAEATGSRSLVNHGETGLLVRTDDIDGFAGALFALVSDPDLRAE